MPDPGPQLAWHEGQPTFRLQDLRGKAVLVLFIQSWCPICNGWSGELIQQIQERYGDDPRWVLLAVKADSATPEAATAYLTSKGGSLDRWLVAADPEAAWMKRVLGDDGLFRYLIIGPDGQKVEDGKAGGFIAKTEPRRFVLAAKKDAWDRMLAKRHPAWGPFLPMATPPEPHLLPVLRHVECGDWTGAWRLVAGMPQGRAGELGERLEGILARRCQELSTRLDETEGHERFCTFIALRDLISGLDRHPEQRAYAKVIKDRSRDRDIKTELRAEYAYRVMLERIQQLVPNKREQALRENLPQFIKAYEGTWFAEVAKGR